MVVLCWVLINNIKFTWGCLSNSARTQNFPCSFQVIPVVTVGGWFGSYLDGDAWCYWVQAFTGCNATITGITRYGDGNGLAINLWYMAVGY